MRLALDMAGIHGVTVRRPSSTGSIELMLEHDSGDRRSIVHEAFARQLRVQHAGARYRFEDGRLTLSNAEGAKLELWIDDETRTAAPLSLATLDVTNETITEHAALEPGAARYRLSPFELRYAADAGRIHPVPLGARGGVPWTPSTDLHTHFAACVRGDDLVALGEEHGIRYPRALLEEAKIHPDAGEPSEHRDSVPLAALAPAVRARLARRLEVPLDRRVTFLEMERIYRARAPLTKSSDLFVLLCRRIAADYARMGVKYVELSSEISTRPPSRASGRCRAASSRAAHREGALGARASRTSTLAFARSPRRRASRSLRPSSCHSGSSREGSAIRATRSARGAVRPRFWSMSAPAKGR